MSTGRVQRYKVLPSDGKNEAHIITNLVPDDNPNLMHEPRDTLCVRQGTTGANLYTNCATL